MKCLKCGTELPKDALFCNKCGCRVAELKEDSSKDECPSKLEVSKNGLHEVVVEQPISSKQNELENVSKSPKKQQRTIIYVLLVICAIFLCIEGFTAYLDKQNKARIEKYIHEMYDDDNGSDTSNDSPNTDLSSSISSIQEEMENMANECDKDLPEYLGYGMTMISCKMEGKSIVYTIEWKGMNSEEFSPDVVEEIRSNVIEGMQEEEKPILNAIISRMREYGYKFAYRYVNEDRDLLCNISISPDEL